MSDQITDLKDEQHSAANERSGGRRQRVLLVEDEPLTRLIILNKLRLAGFDVDVAWNGCLALEKLRTGHPDFIFLDLMLPDIKGVEVIKEARRDPVFGSRPIFVCTAAARMSLWSRRAIDAGATKVFNKASAPIDEIVAEVTAFMRDREPEPGPPSTPVTEADSAIFEKIPPKVQENVVALCTQAQQLAQSADNPTRTAKCGELRTKVQTVMSSAADAELHLMARVAAALEAFLKELCEKAKKVTDSSLHTISSALEVLGLLCHSPQGGAAADAPEFTAVVVDDDLVSRTAVGNALRNAGFKPATFSNPAQALEHIKSHPADLVVFDARLLESQGADLCKEIRELPDCKDTPMLSLASPRDLKRLARKPLASAQELVAKPFIPMELSLKALNLVLKNRAPAPAAPSASAAPPPLPQTAAPTASPPSSGKAASSISAAAASSAPVPAGVTNALFEGIHSQPTGQTSASFEISETGKIVSADEADAALFGWQGPELVGQSFGMLLKPGLEHNLRQFLRQTGTGIQNAESCVFRVVARRKDGTEFPASVTLTEQSNASQARWTMVFQDLAACPVVPPTPVESDPAAGLVAQNQMAALAEALSRLQESQATLQSANEELHKQFEAISTEAATHRDALAKNHKEREELVGRIYSSEIELNRAKTALEREAEERKQIEEKSKDIAATNAELERQLAEERQSKEDLLQSCRQFREQMEGAKSTADRTEASYQQQVARVAGLEQELARLKGTQDELKANWAAEQQAATEARRQGDELQTKTRENVAELERVKAELDEQVAQRKRQESEWREQLTTAKAAAEKAEAAWLEEAERGKHFEDQLSKLRQERDGFSSKLAAEEQTAAETKRRNEELESQLRANTGELEQIKRKLAEQSSERGSAQTHLQEELDAAKAAAEKAEAGHKEEVGRCLRLEAELSSVAKMRDELQDRLAAQQEALAQSTRRADQFESRLGESAAHLQRVQAELHDHADGRAAVESDLKAQLAVAKAAAEQAQTVLRERAVQPTGFERELDNLRQERHEIHARFMAEQQAGAKAKRRIKDLEKQLREGATGFASVKIELEKRATERGRLESELRAQLEAAKGAAEKADTARQEEATRAGRLAEQLDSLRQMHDELNAKWATEQQTVEESRRRIEELESRLRESASELGRARAALDNQAEARSLSDTTGNKAAGIKEDFGLELCRLRENEAAHLAELSELERRVREGVASLAHVTAELEKERAERRRVEQRSAALAVQMQELHEELKQHLESEKATQNRLNEIEQQLREREEAAARTRSELLKETADRQLAEEQLRAAGDMSTQLRKYLSLFEESKKVFKRAQEDLENKLQASHDAVTEAEAKLQKEAAERQRLAEALQAAQHTLQEQSDKNAVELVKLQSELQVQQFERQRIEGDAIQSRYASLDSTRAGRAHVASFCRQIHEPVESVLQSIRRLLEMDLSQPQRKLVETVLESALVVQTSLKETGTSGGGSGRSAGDNASGTDSSRPLERVSENPVGDLQP